MLLDCYAVPRSCEEIQRYIGIANREYFRQSILKPLIDSGKLKRTIPDKPSSKNQKYIKSITQACGNRSAGLFLRLRIKCMCNLPIQNRKVKTFSIDFLRQSATFGHNGKRAAGRHLLPASYISTGKSGRMQITVPGLAFLAGVYRPRPVPPT